MLGHRSEHTKQVGAPPLQVSVTRIQQIRFERKMDKYVFQIHVLT